MTTRRLSLTALAVAAVLVAIVPSAALAKSKDRNHDGISDRWEKKHHLSLQHKQNRKDQDKDGLRNLAEFRHHTDPRDSDSDNDGLNDKSEVNSDNDPNDDDSDNDGVDDGDENAGKITSFDGTTLTIALGGGSSISGLVVAGVTEVKCEGASHATVRHGGGADNSGPGSSSSGPGSGGGDDNENEDASDHGGDEAACGADALKVGAAVHEADLELKNGMAVFDEIELVAAP